MRTRIPNNVERGGQTASTSFNIRENKRNVEWLFERSLMAFELIQHRFNFDSISFNKVERGEQTVSRSLLHKIQPDVEAVCPGPLSIQERGLSDTRYLHSWCHATAVSKRNATHDSPTLTAKEQAPCDVTVNECYTAKKAIYRMSESHSFFE